MSAGCRAVDAPWFISHSHAWRSVLLNIIKIMIIHRWR